MRLAQAHLSLLKVELAEIANELKLLGLLAGVIFVALVFSGLLALIGGTLFIGEWLFGSIGWGVVDGVLLGVGSVVALALAALGVRGGSLGRSLTGALGIGILVAVVLGTNVVRQGAGRVATDLGLAIEAGWAPVVVAVAVGAIVAGLVGLVVGIRRDGGAAIGGLVPGLILGALAGWLAGGIDFSRHGAAAVGLTAGAAAWPILSLGAALRGGLDPAARFKRLLPRQSYEAALETKAQLEETWAKRRDVLRKR